MTTWFVSRHPGALHWMRQCGPAFDRHAEHLDIASVQPGDRVIGTLPVNLAAQVCERGATYWHLALEMPASARGRELSAQELLALGATLQEFNIQPRANQLTPHENPRLPSLPASRRQPVASAGSCVQA